MNGILSRREALLSAGAFAAAAVSTGSAAAGAPSGRPADEPFKYCLNTSTLMGQKLPISDVVDIAAKAGFQGMEPWIRELEAHVKGGGSLKELGKKIADNGLTVESAIGFAPWIVDDDGKRAKGVEQMKREMDMVAEIGGKRIAAPPAGNDNPALDLRKAAERYRVILDIGDQIGVVPEMEFWGPVKVISTLAEAAFIAIQSGHPKACILADIYHMYKGGSGHDSVRLLSGEAIHVIHTNDYPADPPRETIKDEHRVYPGDGIAPLTAFFRNLKAIGFTGALSVELFNREYWKQDAQTVAKTAVEKMRAAVKKAFA
ncbi:MAG TPA: sugar phosphate isomerase/epimerase family protein [Planctomycetota bacterium]|nr:sugar phosphate isomerase/epimerase family protein [Planctomycetota bacterium]